jgi:hypothetical protein
VSDPAEKVRDAIALIHDAQLEGQLRALRRLRERLGERSKQLHGLVVTSPHPGGRVKARGAHEAIEHVLRELDAEIDAVESERRT